MRSILLLAMLLVGCGGGGGDDDATADAAVDAPNVGAACGGRANPACPADQYCDYGRNTCGVTDEVGSCKPRPADCPALLVPEPTCGCDGTVYPSQCHVYLGGSDLAAAGSCTVAAGAFACGYRQCALNNHYCQRTLPNPGEADDYTCKGLPQCPNRNCACLAGQPCGAMCTGQGSTGLLLTCPATTPPALVPFSEE